MSRFDTLPDLTHQWEDLAGPDGRLPFHAVLRFACADCGAESSEPTREICDERVLAHARDLEREAAELEECVKKILVVPDADLITALVNAAPRLIAAARAATTAGRVSAAEVALPWLPAGPCGCVVEKSGTPSTPRMVLARIASHTFSSMMSRCPNALSAAAVRPERSPFTTRRGSDIVSARVLIG
jgi:hypothetical protein